MNFKYDKNASHLKEMDWVVATKFLEEYFPYLEDMVKNLNLKLKVSSTWPRFEIVRSHPKYLNILRFELNPNYMDDNYLSFHCYYFKYRKKFMSKEFLSKEDAFVLSVSEVKLIEENLLKLRNCMLAL